MPTRDELNATPGKSLSPAHGERDHFYVCEECGQAVDARMLGDVLHHEEPGHRPLPVH